MDKEEKLPQTGNYRKKMTDTVLLREVVTKLRIYFKLA